MDAPFTTARRIAVLALLSLGCSRDPQPARTTQSITAPAGVPALAWKAQDEVVLDLRADGDALVARVLPAPEDSDADRRVAARWLAESGPRSAHLAAAPVLEARFVPGTGAVVALTTEHALVRYDAPGATPVELDRDVAGPLSVDLAGRYVAYTRGEMPDFAVVRLELATGRREALAPDLTPAWCPAVLPDGTVLAVASRDGQPALWKLRPGERPERLPVPEGTPFPTGPGAPVVFGDALVFENESGLHALGLDGAPRRSLQGLRLPVYVPGAPRLLAQRVGGADLVSLAPRDLEVTR